MFVRDNGEGRNADHSGSRVRKYFGLSIEEAEELFDDTGCNGAKTPRMAALFIERFCNRKTKERDNVRSN